LTISHILFRDTRGISQNRGKDPKSIGKNRASYTTGIRGQHIWFLLYTKNKYRISRNIDSRAVARNMII